MTDLMSQLYEYTQFHRILGFLDSQAYHDAEQLEERNLAALRQGLSPQGLAALKRYQDCCQERQAMVQEAAFQAGFTIARELLL